MNLFEIKLDRALGLLSENIDKKWPYILKALKDALADDGPPYSSRELLSGYNITVSRELVNDRDKLESLSHHFASIGLDSDIHGLQNVGLGSIASTAKKQGISRELRIPTRLEYIDEYFRKWLVQSDPVARKSNGRKTPYVNHIVRWLINTRAVFPDDVNTIHDMLLQYQKLKHNLGAELPDLNEVEDPNELRSMIMQYEETDAYGSLEDKKLPDIVPGVEVYRLDNFDEAKNIVCDSGWCIADREYFEQYSPPFYIFVRKVGDSFKRLGLFNLESGELKDVYNQDMSLEMLEKLAPIIDYILSDIDFGDYDAVVDRWWNLIPTIAPIIRLLPNTNKNMNASVLGEVVEILKDTIGIPQRWPKHLEEKLKNNPEDFLNYVQTIVGDGRDPDLEEDLIDLAFVYFDRDLGYIASLLGYFGARYDQFDGKWPELSELLDELEKHDDLKYDFIRELRRGSDYGITAFLQLGGSKWQLTDSPAASI